MKAIGGFAFNGQRVQIYAFDLLAFHHIFIPLQRSFFSTAQNIQAYRSVGVADVLNDTARLGLGRDKNYFLLGPPTVAAPIAVMIAVRTYKYEQFLSH